MKVAQLRPINRIRGAAAVAWPIECRMSVQSSGRAGVQATDDGAAAVTAGYGAENRVFFALSDPTRRLLLDRLRARDGQRLSELSTDVGMSRQAISKHLEVLEDARLITVRRTRRETVHFLNRAPLRMLQSGWLNRFTQLHARVDCA
jgi:DNA-binding transcriptional ArsR family regulator